MAGGQFLTLLHATSRSSLVKPTRPFFNNSSKNYGQASNANRGRLMEERAPSTAEEFQRVAEEKTKKGQEGVARQTSDESHDDGAEEATSGGSKVDLAKKRCKKH